MQERDWTVAVWIESSDGGVPLVRDVMKPFPLYWKCPSGRSEAKETPEQAAVREVSEETGLQINEADLEKLHEENRGTHAFVFFTAQVPSPLAGLKPKGNEGEQIKIFHRTQVAKMDDFFPPHRKAAEKTGLL